MFKSSTPTTRRPSRARRGPAEARRAVLARRHHQRQGRLVLRHALRHPVHGRHPTLAKVGVAALKRIRKTNPDLIVLNGDITDNGAAEDLDARAHRRSSRAAAS